MSYENEIIGMELPELVNLPVYREDYISQQRVDELCALIWKERPDDVKQFTFHEKFPFPSNRDGLFERKMGKFIWFLRDEEKAKRVEPISMIAMVDLTYEIDRRVRHALGLKDIQPIGKPIAEGPEGPFPKLIDLPIYRNEKGTPQPGVTQEKADEFCKELYGLLINEHPEIVFSYCELQRRYLRGGEPNWFIFTLVREKFSNKEPNYQNVKMEIGRRLSFMSSTNTAYEIGLKEYSNDR